MGRLLAMLLLAALAAAPTAATTDRARTFLTTAFSLSSAEMRRLDAGDVVAKTLDVTNRREVATLGIVRVDASPRSYITRLADIATFKRTDDVLEIGTFTTVPQRADVAA